MLGGLQAESRRLKGATAVLSLALVVLLLPGCGLTQPTMLPLVPPPPGAGGAPSPLEAARRSMSAESGFRPLAVRPLRDGVLVVYRYDQPPQGDGRPEQGFGYTLAVQQGGGWITPGAGGTNGEPIPPGEIVEYGLLTLPERRVAIVGEVLKEEASAVEVLLSSGDTLRDTLTEGRGFVLVVSGPDQLACELRLLDQQETVIAAVNLPDC